MDKHDGGQPLGLQKAVEINTTMNVASEDGNDKYVEAHDLDKEEFGDK